jgi:hypothetical protein
MVAFGSQIPHLISPLAHEEEDVVAVAMYLDKCLQCQAQTVVHCLAQNAKHLQVPVDRAAVMCQNSHLVRSLQAPPMPQAFTQIV